MFHQLQFAFGNIKLRMHRSSFPTEQIAILNHLISEKINATTMQQINETEKVTEVITCMHAYIKVESQCANA